MKKQYISPLMEIVIINDAQPLLAGSGETLSVDNNDPIDNDDALSRSFDVFEMLGGTPLPLP